MIADSPAFVAFQHVGAEFVETHHDFRGDAGDNIGQLGSGELVHG